MFPKLLTFLSFFVSVLLFFTVFLFFVPLLLLDLLALFGELLPSFLLLARFAFCSKSFFRIFVWTNFFLRPFVVCFLLSRPFEIFPSEHWPTGKCIALSANPVSLGAASGPPGVISPDPSTFCFFFEEDGVVVSALSTGVRRTGGVLVLPMFPVVGAPNSGDSHCAPAGSRSEASAFPELFVGETSVVFSSAMDFPDIRSFFGDSFCFSVPICPASLE
mmetsp:Transcript_35237/g.81545  ORF Transcript_35237/g.81545 Transcript_35237/m.81545 type:complete len:218 (+) Transcript_35237:1752-2405(+)